MKWHFSNLQKYLTTKPLISVFLSLVLSIPGVSESFQAIFSDNHALTILYTAITLLTSPFSGLFFRRYNIDFISDQTPCINTHGHDTMTFHSITPSPCFLHILKSTPE